jgi:hypothetical protein
MLLSSAGDFPEGSSLGLRPFKVLLKAFEMSFNGFLQAFYRPLEGRLVAF